MLMALRNICHPKYCWKFPFKNVRTFIPPVKPIVMREILEQESVGERALSLESYSSTAVHAVMNSQAVHVK